MAQTVVGLFDTSAEAQEAVETLTSSGFLRGNIDISNAGSTTASASTSTQDNDHEEGGIGKFFRSLFTDDDDHEKYTNVAKRGGSIVTVHAQTAEQAEEAADILDECGAVNVDERAATYNNTGAGAAATTGSADYLGATGTTGATGTGDYVGTTGTVGTGDYLGTSGATGTGDYLGTTGIADHLGTTGTTGTADYLGTTGASDDLGTTGLAGDVTTGDTQKIPVIEENLEVGKREVLTGGVRLRSRIVERPVEESLRLREENVRVERTPVNRAATSADLANFEGAQIEMTETAEVPVVSKEARVVEEVSLDKEVTERTETISDTVRKTEVDVENIEGKDSNRTF